MDSFHLSIRFLESVSNVTENQLFAMATSVTKTAQTKKKKCEDKLPDVKKKEKVLCGLNECSCTSALYIR